MQQTVGHSSRTVEFRVGLSCRYEQNGDELAGELYENSALLAAHAIKGLANVFRLDLTDPSTVVIGHGGGFKFRDYGRRIVQILERSEGVSPNFFMTHEYSPNACADGAGKAAIVASGI